MHLRMTGTLLYDPPPGTPYERVRWTLDDGHQLRFCDPRRFGTGELALGTPARDAFFAARLGLEPLDGELTGEALRRMARGRRAPVKAFLLDQRRIAGVGNIYADEALFRAGIHPLRRVGGAGALGGLRRELGQSAALVGLHELLEAADEDLADDDLREAQHPGLLDELRASSRVLCQIDLVEVELADAQQLLGALAERARLCRVDGDLGHYFTKYSEGVVAGPVKVQGVVLRSLRFGEADRILHVYTPQRGKLGAIAKGVRRARSRFGGRLEPFFRVNLVLHEGRGHLLPVTAAETIAGHPRLREHAGALDTAARACDAVGRLFDTSEPPPGG